MNVGKIIKLFRISLGIKQRDLASRIGVTPNYLSLVESNKREPSLTILKSISNQMNIPISLLFLEGPDHYSNLPDEQKGVYNEIKDKSILLKNPTF